MMSKEGDTEEEEIPAIFVQFVTQDDEDSGSPIQVPVNFTAKSLTETIDTILEKEKGDAFYNFFVKDVQILDSLQDALTLTGTKVADLGTEEVVRIIYQPQAVFKVRAVTRCTSSLPGHKAPVLVALFSPDGRYMASGSGDASVRLWDLDAEMPHKTLTEGHSTAILCLAWSPCGSKLASACKQGTVCVWKGSDGERLGRPLNKVQLTSKNKTVRSIRSIVWKPLHLDGECRLLAAAYQDADVVIWDVVLGQPILTLSGHTKPVTSLRWGGTNLVYTGSQDCSIKVWRADDGVMCRTLSCHGHWVNTLALSTDYVVRTGAFDPAKATLVKYEDDPDTQLSKSELQSRAKAMYDSVKRGQPERLAAGSDDNTLSLWTPEVDKKPLCPRMTGHMAVVNDVKFSPDARLLASASFDHSIKIWDGVTGQFLTTLFGHVQDVYLVAWSGDSRLLVSGSRDSTLKLWSMAEVRRSGKKRHLLHDLPGHADAIYALDWSPDGQKVVSGGKDKVIKMWRA